MKHIKKFNSTNSLNAIYGTADYANPNVYLVNNEIQYDKGDYLICVFNTQSDSIITDGLWKIFNGPIFDEILIDGVKWDDPMNPKMINAVGDSNDHILKIKFKEPTKIGETAPILFNSFIKSVSIPTTFTQIKTNAFNGCNGFTNLIIPDSITSIENSALVGCNSLTTLYIGSGVNEITSDIGTQLYITDLTIGAKQIKQSAFNGIPLHNLTILDSVELISMSFTNTALQNITIGNGCTSIDQSFNYCNRLYELNISGQTNLSITSSFCQCDKLSNITLGSGVKSILNSFMPTNTLSRLTDLIIEDVTTLTNNVFSNCPRLTNLQFGDGVQTISNSAFTACTALESLTLGNNTQTITTGAFTACTALKSLTLGNNITELGTGIFNGCTSLLSLNIPNSVITISSAFINCTSLDVNIPSSVTSIANNAFGKCKSISIDSNNVNYESIDNFIIKKEGNVLISSAYKETANIPNSVTKIDAYAFGGHDELVTVNIPDSVISIQQNAFVRCPLLSQESKDRILKINPDYQF